MTLAAIEGFCAFTRRGMTLRPNTFWHLASAWVSFIRSLGFGKRGMRI